MQWYLYGGKTTILNDGLLIDSTDHKMTTWILLKVKLNREGTGDTCSLIMHYFLLYNKIYVSGFSTRKSIQKTPIQSQIHENKYDCMPNTKQLSFPTTCLTKFSCWLMNLGLKWKHLIYEDVRHVFAILFWNNSLKISLEAESLLFCAFYIVTTDKIVIMCVLLS